MSTTTPLSVTDFSTAAESHTPIPIGEEATSVPAYVQGIATSTHSRMPLESPPKTIRNMRDVTAMIVAEQVVDFCNAHGDLITNLRLQKLLYYIQAWFLALHNEPLFSDPIVASASGPIQETVFSEYQYCGIGPIVRPSRGRQVPKKLAGHIQDVMEAYGHLSTFDLERVSKSEEPWRSARQNLDLGDAARPVIPMEVMKRFYEQKHRDAEEEEE